MGRVSTYMRREASQNLIPAYNLLLRNLEGVLTSCLVERFSCSFSSYASVAIHINLNICDWGLPDII